MSIEFACPTCNGTLRVGDESAGRVIRCGACMSMLRVPGAPTEPEDAAPPGPPPRERRDAPDAPDAPPSPFEHGDEPRGADRPRAAVPVARPRTRPDDPDDRPRPRGSRRRPPPPPPGRGVLFWLVLVGLGGLLLTVGCCGGLFLVIPGPQWQKLESEKGKFKVDVPAPPQKDMAKFGGGQADPNMTTEGAFLIGRGEEFVVVHGEIPANERAFLTDKQRIDAAVDAMKTSGEVQSLLSSKDITVEGFPAREVEFSAKGGGWYAVRVIIAESRVYVLVAGGRFAKSGNANARRFLDSFELTDPNLKLAGKKKEEDAKQAANAAQLWKEQQEQNRLAAEKAEQERLAAEAEKQKEAERVAAEKRKIEEARRAAAEAVAERFLAPRGGKAPPDPNDLPGLVLHLPCDEIADEQTPTAAQGTAKVPTGATIGPGVRGSAIYLGAYPQGVSAPATDLPPLLAGQSATVAGWLKVRGVTGDLVAVPVAQDRRAPIFSAGLTTERVEARFLTIVRPDPVTGRPVAGVSAEWTPDEKWHHVAVVRRVEGKRTVVNLYLDGALVAVYPLPGPRMDAGAGPLVQFGQAVPLIGGKSVPARLVRLKDDHYDVPDHDLPISAIDDVCAYGRALTEPEVRYLAGAGPRPAADAKPVRLVPEATVEPLAGVAFDPARGTVWTVTAVGGYWALNERPKERPAPQLRAHSYPDFKPGASYLFPTDRDRPGLGGPPVLDPKGNRLYLPVSAAQRAFTNLQRRPESDGFIYRFDLDDLPEAKGAPAPVLKPSAQMKPTHPNSSVEALDIALAPDGETLYYFDALNTQLQTPPMGAQRTMAGNWVCRVPADLQGPPKAVFAPTAFPWKGPIWVSPDGKTVRAITSSRNPNTQKEQTEVLEVDVASWKSRVVPLPGANWPPPPVVAWHPDGRLFVSMGLIGVLEFDPTAGTRRLRPVPVGPTAFLSVSADGRYLIASDAEMAQANFGAGTLNRVAVLDAARAPAQLGELAWLDEGPNLRVGGPCWPSPDGRFVVFRSGVVLRIDDGRPPATKPKPVPKLPVAPPPRLIERE